MKTPTLRSALASVCWLLAFIMGGNLFAEAPAPNRSQQRFEIRFLTEMIDHHFGAVKMSELCTARATHAELKTMCEEMKAAQLQEIAMMQQWLQSWYGISHEPRLDRKTQRQLAELSALSGAEFEKRFLMMMSEHHAMAIMMGADCLLRAYHSEMIAMCAKMIGDQADEVAMFRMWLMQWYGITDVGHGHHHQ